jgi:hypothetical protein
VTTETSPPAAELFASLRDKLFRGDLASMTGAVDANTTGDEIFGVAMEVGLPRGTALVFGLRDGSASLYLSSGGGSIGGQGRPQINLAAKKLVQAARGLVDKLPRVEEYPLPPTGQVRFSLFTSSGVRAAQVSERDLLGGQSELLPLFVSANEILAGFRLAEEQGRANEPLYFNCLLTALARGSATSVVLTAGTTVPDPSTLTTDPQDLAWFSSIGFSLEAQSTEKVIDLILKTAGFRPLSFGKKEGTIRASLAARDGKASSIFTFRVTKRSTHGRVQVEIVPVRGGTG